MTTRGAGWGPLVAAALVAAVATPACRREALLDDPTSVVVSVNSDLTVGTDFTQILITPSSGRGQVTVPFTISAAGDLPVSLAVLPAGDSSETFTVTASALQAQNETPVVSQTVQTAFVAGQASLLNMFLSSHCISMGCMPNQTCDEGMCGPQMRPVMPWGGSNSGLQVLYKTPDSGSASMSPKPFFKIENKGKDPVPLQELTLRYWFTADGATADELQAACDYADAGRANVTLDFHPVSPPRSGADFYMEIGFTAAAGPLSAGFGVSQLQDRFNATNFVITFDQDNDYSFDGTKSADFALWPRVTLYRNGVLVWGIEPT
jgi:hypothetical protein